VQVVDSTNNFAED
jgi:hypothetical protein